MERRIAAMAAGWCLLLGSVAWGQAPRERDERAAATLDAITEAGNIELGRETKKAADGGGGVIRAGAAPMIVIGFVGGFVRHENTVHSPVQVGQRLRKAFPAGVYVEVFENSKREAAHQRILELLDVTHDGKLSEEEKRSARIVIYGMSWGGSETVTL